MVEGVVEVLVVVVWVVGRITFESENVIFPFLGIFNVNTKLRSLEVIE